MSPNTAASTFNSPGSSTEGASHPVHHPLPFTVPEIGRERGVRVALLFSFHNNPSERRPYVFTGYSIENGRGKSVWKGDRVEGAYALWSDMHCNSRLVANLVPFWG